MSERGRVEIFFMRLIPFPSQLNPQKGTKEFRRVRALTVMLVTTTFSTLFWTLVIAWMYYMEGMALEINMVISLAVLFTLGFQTYCFYRFGSVRFSAAFLTMSYFFMAAALVFVTGVYNSALKPLLLSSPVISFRIGGKEEGIMNTIFVGILGVLMIFADYKGFVFENLLANASDHFLSLTAWLVTITVIVTCMMAYDVDEKQ